MATAQHLLLSPAELAYLRSSLSLTPPIRPDGRTATQFRPLTAETGILPGTHGSARVCFADGTEAIVGVKAEVERTTRRGPAAQRQKQEEEEEKEEESSSKKEVSNDWVEMTVEIPGYRDDDSSTVFLAAMLSEALLADGTFAARLWINRRFHWKLYLDIILISSPLSYPLPLLSLTTHLALLATRLPRLKSELDEDPMFDDDWAASTFLYSRQPTPTTPDSSSRPPITLLVMAVGDNIVFDPSKEELAVADSALAVSVAEGSVRTAGGDEEKEAAAAMDVDGDSKAGTALRLLSVRTIDPPSRLTAPGVPNAVNAAAWGQGTPVAKDPGARTAETEEVEGVWKPPRGGTKISVLNAMVEKVLEKGGVADEVLEALEGVELC
ncbi:ribosomal protein S5 domain 2-type protein [Xylariomycetidae sp. FL0641]|nr:ribosomal protein S5 domain 2-type protein [Xylariomycetidae sp. FL0641]